MKVIIELAKTFNELLKIYSRFRRKSNTIKKEKRQISFLELKNI